MSSLGRRMHKVSPWLVFCAVLGLGLGGTGCDTDSEDFDFEPAAGKGALIVDNVTPDDINVYVDGAFLGQVGDNDDRAFELNPGIHRIVLDEEEDGKRNAAEDIDILEGRLTVLRVALRNFSSDQYDLSIDLQD